jgi:CHAT domain-containing protein/tetratricopeptide (TPR) repeat protein
MHWYRIIALASGVLLFPFVKAGAQDIPRWRELITQSEQLEKARQFDSAKAAAFSALASARNECGEVDSSVALALHRIGAVCFALKVKQVDSALVYWQKAREMWRQLGDVNQLSLAKTYNNIASAYNNRSLENYKLSAAYHDSSLQIKLRYLQPDDPSLAATYTNLSELYALTFHDVVTGEKYARMAVAIRMKEQPPNPAKILLARWKLANVLFTAQRYDSAIQIYDDISKEQLHNGDTAGFIGLAANAARCHVVLAHYQIADSMYRNLLSMSERPGIEAYFTYQNVLGLGRVLRRSGKADSAMVYLSRALSMEQSGGGVVTDSDWMLRYELGMAFLASHQTDSARIWLADALDMCEQLYGKFHDESARVLSQLALTYRAGGEFDTALRLLDSSYSMYFTIALEQMSGMIEEDALRYQKNLKIVRELYASCLLDAPSLSAETKWRAAEILSFSKGMTTDLVAARRRIARSSHRPALDSLRQEMAIQRSERSRLALKHADSIHSIDSISLAIEGMERRVTDELYGELKTYATSDRGLKELCSHIPESSVAIDYHVLTEYDKFNTKLEPYLIAVVLHHSMPLEIVNLGTMAPIEASIAEYRDHMNKVAGLGHYPTTALFEEYLQISSRLNELVLKPLASSMRNVKAIAVSPDGFLNQISFAGLMDTGQTFLAESYSLSYLNTLHDLAAESWDKPVKQVLVLGNPDFAVVLHSEPLTAEQSKDTHTHAYLRAISDSCANISLRQVLQLPATNYEADQTKQVWERNGIKVFELLWREATEERFRALVPDCQIAHLATHGYWLSDKCDDQSRNGSKSVSMLLSSGLLFAGANSHTTVWQNYSTNDGFLTSDDILGMDLPNTQLVVLSTCESGLGEVVQGEGVYGLRRAFALAGVHTVVSSLWKIPDHATADFFSQFYPFEQVTIADKLQGVQLDYIRKLRQQGLPPHPFLWASFIATGGR